MKTATAKDVHNEFDRVANELLTEATRIVSDSEKKKGFLSAKMRQLGFGNSVSVKEELERLDSSKNLLNARLLYPQNNFFTEKAIGDICKKYGLLMAKSGDYIGEIPLKNQEEIAAFKLAPIHQFVKAIDRKKFSKNIQEIKDIKRSKNSKSFLGSLLVGVINDITIGRLKREYEIVMSKKKFLVANDPNLSFRSETLPELMIVATPENFNLANKEIVGEYMVIDKDPVVLCKVEGGLIQVSAWGNEASHDEFVTPAKN